VGNAAIYGAPYVLPATSSWKTRVCKTWEGDILTGSSVVFRFAGIAIKSFFLVLNKIGTLFRRTKLELIFIKDKI
jgi:hypothetical protein